MRDPFFVVTTGRSGSVSLALTLSQHPFICALHEPWRYLIELSWKRLAGEAPGPGSAVGLFRRWVPVPAGVQMCGVVDQKLVPFIADLAAAFSGCKFVWLVRDGRCVVASGYERGWYSSSQRSVVSSQRAEGNPWEVWRWRGDEVVDSRQGQRGTLGAGMTAAEWEGLGWFGRNCWYWAWVNRRIGHELHELGEEGERWRMVKLEELAGRSLAGARDDRLSELVEWLGVPVAEGMEMVRANRGPGRLRWETWSGEQRGVFEDVCGGMMEELGYGISSQ